MTATTRLESPSLVQLAADAIRKLILSGELAAPRPRAVVAWYPVTDLRLVDRSLQDAVLGGMGLLVLHSGHYSKILRRLLGTSCSLRWRNAGERELVWTVAPAHPIARDVPHPIVIGAQEMYGEHFDIPEPDELVFISSFAGGEVFRGHTWHGSQSKTNDRS